MPTDRLFGKEEIARRKGYDHSAPKDGNFNPTARERAEGYDTLKRRMKTNYQSPGLRGESSHDRQEAVYTSDRVPRRKD
jgi:hypothetical protein